MMKFTSFIYLKSFKQLNNIPISNITPSGYIDFQNRLFVSMSDLEYNFT